MFFLLLVVLAMANAVLAENKTLSCGQVTILEPTDIIRYSSFSLPQYQRCLLTISFPANYAARIDLNIVGANNATIYNACRSYQHMFNGNLTTGVQYWPPAVVYINMEFSNLTAFTLSVDLVDMFENVGTPILTSIVAGQQPFTFSENFLPRIPYVFTATNKAVLAYSADHMSRTEQWPDFAVNTFVFDGPNISAPLVGSLDSFESIGSYMSSGRSLTLYSLLNATTDRGVAVSHGITFNSNNNQMVIVNDNSNVAGLSRYDYYSTNNMTRDLTIALDATNGSVSISVTSFAYDCCTTPDEIYLDRIHFSSNTSTVKVYNSYPVSNMSEYYVLEYNSETAQSNAFPQLFPLHRLTFVLDSGTAEIGFGGINEGWNTWDARVSTTGIFYRTGYLMSKEYGSVQNNATGGSMPFSGGFQFTVTTEASQFKSNDSYLALVSTESMNDRSFIYKQPGSGNYSIVSNSIVVKWFDGTEPTRGQLMKFRMDEVDEIKTTTPKAGFAHVLNLILLFSLVVFNIL